MYPAAAAPDINPLNSTLRYDGPHSDVIQQGSVVVPGEVIFSSVSNLITGHGTYRSTDADPFQTSGIRAKATVDSSSEGLKTNLPSSTDPLSIPANIRTSLTGRVRIVNKLVYVEPPRARYSGNIGDTVVGRIIEVEQRRWRVDVNSTLLGNLALANVKLPGGELRRKSEDDERAMRTFMKEGDLVVAEIHEIYKDGTLQLHMPGTRTGKLGGGCLLRVPPSLIKRQKIHRHRLAVPRVDTVQGPLVPTPLATTEVVSVGLILGNNGYVWIGPARAMDIGIGLSAPLDSDSVAANRVDLLAERIAVSRVRNCLLALARFGMPIWETSVLAACEGSWLTDQQLDDYDYGDEAQMDVDPEGQRSSSANTIVSNRIARLLHPEIAHRLYTLVQAKLKSAY